MQKAEKKIVGFTLVELLSVVVVLGLIAVVAFSRFVNLSDEANDASLDATKAAFKQGVKNVQTRWRLDGMPRTNNNQGPSVIVSGEVIVVENGTGFPVGSDNRDQAIRMSTNDCVTVFNQVLDGGQTVLRRRGNNNPDRETRRSINYLSTRFNDNANGDVCHYYLTSSLTDDQNNPRHQDSPSIGQGFSYFPATGEVTVFNFL
ncbi:prepilin-type N-terminal cleavage/methylation domain-containing protein [Catenovulum sp. SM1970]|uniref:prepilin-type N-terminal cleavage/methylation domain-containing protein n=1 Tax=Marinifaba aquimaris TaxID=2741323 RepID=UPI001571612D|nr:prepilin-type N-terminal cleavage/methylation domain-containing protein [Marinifaba aquimaris]NTS76247.1 prepilin-type N-terminal cleavage/methylation domain-containing protein [Marinifaba aquimaris]